MGPTQLAEENVRRATYNQYEIGWHHTSLSAAVSILSNDYVFASWATALNDSTEVTYGAEMLQEVASAEVTSGWPAALVALVNDVDELRALVQREAFIFSVSEHENALNNWALYGPVALGFAISDMQHSMSPPHLAVLNERWKGTEKPSEFVHPNGMSAWQRVIYDQITQRAAAAGVLEEISTMVHNPDLKEDAVALQAQGLVIRYVLGMKHPDFKPEGETRFVAYRPDDPHSVHYRVAGGNVIPYVKVTANHKSSQQYARGRTDEVGSVETLPIYAIKLDASVSDEARIGLNDLYRQRGHGEAEDIERSDTPYRRGL
jgi:hypothetical protein